MVSDQQAADARGTQIVTGRAEQPDRSPSAWNRRLVIVALAAVDFALAGHMALYQWSVIDTVWDPVFGTEQSQQVLNSSVSEAFRGVFTIPDAALGAIAYLAEVVLGLVGSRQRWRRLPWLVVVFALNALAVTLVGLGLVVLQAVVVQAWCLLCLITAALSLLMLLLALPEARASIAVLRRGR